MWVRAFVAAQAAEPLAPLAPAQAVPLAGWPPLQSNPTALKPPKKPCSCVRHFDTIILTPSVWHRLEKKNSAVRLHNLNYVPQYRALECSRDSPRSEPSEVSMGSAMAAGGEGGGGTMVPVLPTGGESPGKGMGVLMSMSAG